MLAPFLHRATYALGVLQCRRLPEPGDRPLPSASVRVPVHLLSPSHPIVVCTRRPLLPSPKGWPRAAAQKPCARRASCDVRTLPPAPQPLAESKEEGPGGHPPWLRVGQPNSHVAPTIAEKQLSIQRQQLHGVLEGRLDSRPGPLDLVSCCHPRAPTCLPLWARLCAPLVGRC
jgi:hypothetical protein